MTVGGNRGGWKSWAVVFVPPCVVLLFGLLSRWTEETTAGGLSFLTVMLVAYFLFPRTKLSLLKILTGLLLALVVAYVLAAAGPGQR